MKFSCPHCGQHIAAEEDWAGMETDCPTCSHKLTIPHPSSEPASIPPPIIAPPIVKQPIERAAVKDQMLIAGPTPLARKDAGTEEPSVTCPHFVQAMQFAQAQVTPRDWLTSIIGDLKRAGAQQVALPSFGPNNQATKLVRRIAQDADDDLENEDPLGDDRQNEQLKIVAGFETHGEAYGIAAALALMATYKESEWIAVQKAWSRALKILAAWDDPRGTDMLISALRGDNGRVVGEAAELLIDKREKRALFDAICSLSYWLGLQDRCLAYLQKNRCSLTVPYGLVELYLLFGKKKLKTHLPDELKPILYSRVAVASLIGLVARVGDEIGHRVCREVYAYSLIQDDILDAASELHEYNSAEDVEPVALMVAAHACRGTWSDRDRFRSRLEFLVRHPSPAGWWAMDRFCRTAEQEKVEIPVTAQCMQRLTKPPNDCLRRLEQWYVPFLDAEPCSLKEKKWWEVWKSGHTLTDATRGLKEKKW